MNSRGGLGGLHHWTKIDRSDDVRMLLGIALLASPAMALSPVVEGPLNSREQAVIRILGGRQLVQGLLVRWRPTSNIVLIGAVTDLLHGLSMFALAKASQRWRAAATIDGGYALGLAVSGFFRQFRRPRMLMPIDKEPRARFDRHRQNGAEGPGRSTART